MTPRSEALAFRIWQYCEPLGWDCTSTEVADVLGVSVWTVSNICKSKGWSERLRTGYGYWQNNYRNEDRDIMERLL
jgi:hypothetical protein